MDLILHTCRSPGSYIFPSLTYASGPIKVEPWNDFDCTKLIPKERDLINTALKCNGTNVTAVNGEVSPNATASSVLSKGAWAGIGVGIAVVVIGGIAAVIWIVLYLRHLLNNLQASAATQQTKESEKSHATSKQDLKLDQTQQLDGQGIVREKPDDHLREMHALPAEKPDDQIHELPASGAGSSSATAHAVDGDAAN